MSKVDASQLLDHHHAGQRAPQLILHEHGQPDPSTSRFWKRPEFQAWCETWCIEYISMGLCIACAVTIAAVLLLFDGQPLPTLPRGITMNAIVSVLATASKSNLLLLMASSISQLKWVRYQKNAPLHDMQLFEDAARGPLGSLQLLTRYGFSSLASVGASILILSLAFEPFVQQVLTYPILPSYVNSSQVVTSQSRTFLVDDLTHQVDMAIGAGVYTGDFVPPTSCPSSNCTWDRFPSLSLCSTCAPAEFPPTINCTFDRNLIRVPDNIHQLPADQQTQCNITYAALNVTDQLTVTVRLSGWQINGDPSIRIYDISAPTYQVSEIYPRRDLYGFDDVVNQTFHGVPNPLLAIGVTNFSIFVDHIEIIDAQVCTLNFCLEDHKVDVVNGVAQVTTSNTRNGNAFHPNPGFDIDDPLNYWCWSPQDQEWDQSAQAFDYDSFYADEADFAFCTLGWFREWGHAVGSRVAGNLSSSCEYLCDNNSTSSCGMTGQNCSVEFQSASLDSVQQFYQLGADLVMGNIAQSLNHLSSGISATPITGQAIFSVVHIHVQWVWLTLPAALILAGVAFFIFTVLTTQKSHAPLWKSSFLAILFHGLEEHEIKVAPIANTVAEMTRAAATMDVCLKSSEYDERIVLGRSNGATTTISDSELPSCGYVEGRYEHV